MSFFPRKKGRKKGMINSDAENCPVAIIQFSIEHGDLPSLCKCLPEGNASQTNHLRKYICPILRTCELHSGIMPKWDYTFHVFMVTSYSMYSNGACGDLSHRGNPKRQAMMGVVTIPFDAQANPFFHGTRISPIWKPLKIISWVKKHQYEGLADWRILDRRS